MLVEKDMDGERIIFYFLYTCECKVIFQKLMILSHFLLLSKAMIILKSELTQLSLITFRAQASFPLPPVPSEHGEESAFLVQRELFPGLPTFSSCSIHIIGKCHKIQMRG